MFPVGPYGPIPVPHGPSPGARGAVRTDIGTQDHHPVPAGPRRRLPPVPGRSPERRGGAGRRGSGKGGREGPGPWLERCARGWALCPWLGPVPRAVVLRSAPLRALPQAAMAQADAAGDAGLGPAQQGAELAAVIGATVPTGFEHTAAEEVREKLGSASRISRDRGKIYFEVPARSLPQVRAGSAAPLCPRGPCGSGRFGSVHSVRFVRSVRSVPGVPATAGLAAAAVSAFTGVSGEVKC